MTISNRISIATLSLLAALAVTLGAAWLGYQQARADDSPPVLLDAGVAAAPDAGTAPSSSSAADKLHDPASSPAAAFDDLKAAKKVGWSVVAFALLVMLARLASRFGKPGTFLAGLGKGKAAVVVGAVGAIAAACYNAAADGGAWTATLAAGVAAALHYLDGGAKPKEQTT